MRHRFWSTLLLAVLLVAASPRDAAAVSFWEWLEQLSGPGPFHGWGLELKFACYGYRLPAVAADEENLEPAPSRFFLDVNCSRAARTRVRVEFGVESAWASTDDNPLVYDPTPDRSRRKVREFSFLPTVDVSLRREVSVGFGIGLMHFHGDVFPSFTKVAVEPLRFTYKPLSTFGRTDRERFILEFLQLRAVTRWIPDGFTAEDFGAVPGTFDSDGEFLTRFAVEVNVLHLLPLLRQ